MAFPQSWTVSERATRSSNGLIVTKSGDHPAALSIISDFCIPSKHIILSSPDSGDAADAPDLGGGVLPSLGVRIDSSSGVPNSSAKIPVPAGGVSSAKATSLAFLDEVGVSRASIKRLQVSAIKAPIYYFEITPTSALACTDEHCGVAVGLAAVESVQTYGADQCPLSIGYHSSGRFIHEEDMAVGNEGGFGTHDTIGCGLEIGGKGRVFFTCNGNVIGANVFTGFGIRGEAYYPVVILQGSGTTVKTNFGASLLQFRPDGLNVCNYAFVFHENALLQSKRDCSRPRATSVEIPVPNNSFDHNPDDDDLDEVTHPRVTTWGAKDLATIDSALLMLEQIIEVQKKKQTTLEKGRDSLGGSGEFDQELLDSYQDIFHLKIQRALSTGLKTISDLVQNDGLASELQQRVAPCSPGDSASAASSNPSTPSTLASVTPRKPSKNTIEMVLTITDSLTPIWQKMLDLISQSLAAPPSIDLHLSNLLSLNDKITAVITELEALLSITLPRAVNRSIHGRMNSPSKGRDRGFTEPVLGSAGSMFSWPGRLCISIQGVQSQPDSICEDDEDESERDFAQFADLDSLTSPPGSWPTPRQLDLNNNHPDAVPRTVLGRQGTRTQIALPSLHELMTNLRRGSAEDVAKVADLIYHLFSDMAGYRRRSNSANEMLKATSRLGMNQVHCKLIKNIVEQGGLLVLLQALARCSEWPEVEIKVSRAVTVLTTCETDYHLIMRKSNEIVTAMNLLLLKGGGTPVAGVASSTSNEDSLVDTSIHGNGTPVGAGLSTHTDDSIFQELVAMAVGNMCGVIRTHWEKESLIDVEVNTATSSPRSESSDSSYRRFGAFSKSKSSNGDMVPFQQPSSLSLHRSHSASKPMDGRTASSSGSQNLTRCVESLLHIITFLIKPPESIGFDLDQNMPMFTKTAVLCCQAVCSLTQVSPLKQLVVEKRGREEGILDLLVNWVNICAEEVLASSNELPVEHLERSRSYASADIDGPVPYLMSLEGRNPLLFELIESVACAISSLCMVDRRGQLLTGRSDFDMLGTSEYAVGVIDAQMKAVSVPAAIVKFVESVAPEVFAEPKVGLTMTPMCGADGQSEHSSSTTPAATGDATNESARKNVVLLPYPLEIPSWCSIALMRSTFVHFAEALSSMTCRHTNRAPVITSALCSIMVTAAAQTARHRRSRFNFEHPSEEYGPEKLLQMHQRELEEDYHLNKCASACLNGLCSFVNDALNTTSLTLGPGPTWGSQQKFRDEEALPPVIKEIMSYNVLDTLKLVATLPEGEARLGAFRLMSMIADWPVVLEKMVDMSITEILVSFVKDVDDANEWNIKPGGGHIGSSPTSAVVPGPIGLARPRSERGVSGDTVRSAPSEDAISALSSVPPPLALEELMRVLYFIAQVCEYSFHNAAKLYDEGLMRVMLNLTKHYKKNVEIHRQALRSISAMCPVLSSITPGGHPAQVIEKLTSAKENAEIHMVQNAARRESAKSRLEFNLLIFVEALRALAHALLSPSSLVQKEALRGISLLAVDDQLRVGIVEGPLKQVIRIFVDPSTEQEVKDLAEQVFVNIGFHNGSKDLEIVANDSDLLSDWFYMKRSMRPQALAYDLTRHWIDALFYGEEKAERRARRQFMLTELGHNDCQISDEADSLSLHLPGGLAIDLRDTLDLPGLDVLKGMLEKLVLPQTNEDRQSGGVYLGSVASSHEKHSELRDALHQQFLFLFDSWHMLNQMYFVDHMGTDHQNLHANGGFIQSPYYDVLPAAKSRQKSSPSTQMLGRTKKKKSGVSLFSDTFFRYINHCSSRLSAQKILDEEENERLERELEAERRLMGPLSAISSDIAFQSPPYHGGKGVHALTPSKSVEVRPIRKKQVSSSMLAVEGSDPLVALYDDLSSRVIELLDFIFPSKLFQLYLCDLVSCGNNNVTGVEDFVTPTAHQFRALLLPPREYLSFHREGRIIERIFDDIKTKGYQSEKPTFDYTANVLSFGQSINGAGSIGNANVKMSSGAPTPANVLWAVSFRDSKFEGEFFATFANTLHKCPSISTLNFVMQTPTLDSRLGYLAGDVPPTVHFLTFENALSSDSLQIMCVLLRTQNAAWHKGNADKSSKNYYRQRRDSSATSDRGLFGLAIRLHSLSDEDVKHITELLDPSGESNLVGAVDLYIYKSPAQRNKLPPTATATLLDDQGDKTNFGEAAAAQASNAADDAPVPVNTSGLKYLDLSDNRLSDAQCGEVLKAGAFGPLEGLELGGNLIQRGLYFSDSLQFVLSRPNVTLKHLGISFCGLATKCFVKVLNCISSSEFVSLTSLDASSNSLVHSTEIKEAIHDLLKKNRTLRMIDLSNNNFNNETVRAINLGLLENESTVLMLKLTLNPTMKAQELSYVREKLWRNREQYATQRSSTSYRHVSVDMSGACDSSPFDCYADAARERATMDSADAIAHTVSLPAGCLTGTALSRETSTTSSSGVTEVPITSPMRRSSSDAVISGADRSRSTSKDSTKTPSGSTTPTAKVASAKSASEAALNRSVSNPFITISDTGRRRSGTGVSSRQEAMDAVTRFAVDGTALNVDLNGIAFRQPSADDRSIGMLEQYNPDAVQAFRVDEAYPVSVVGAVAVSEAAVLLGSDNESGAIEDRKGGTMAARPADKQLDDELNKSTRSMYSDVGAADLSTELWVLFSAPLAWRDAESGILRPIEMLNYKNEKDTLWQVFREGQRDIDLHFNYATTDQLRTAVTLGCKALHFSGHGHPDWLNFEDGRSGLQIVTVERLEKLCSAGGIKLDFVFVSACYSRKAGEAFAAAGVKHVVCVSVDAQLLDTAATIFTRAFYLALVVGENVDKAFEIGQNAVAASPSVPNSMKEQDKFLLLPQDKPHDVPIFRAPTVPKWPPENSAAMRWEERLTPDYLPEPPEDFEGREVDMYEVITALHKRHLVSIVGERGLGKSAVAVAAMRYLTERSVFENGAVYVKLQHVSTYEGFLNTFQRALASTCPVAAEKLHQLHASNRGSDHEGSSESISHRYKKDPLFTQEDLLISCVASLKLLIVFDHANNLLTTGEVGADVTMFLGNLLEGRRNIRVLLTSTVGVGFINGFGIVEKCVKLGPLTLYNSLRLFARLTPALVTAKQRYKFIQSLTPKPLGGSEDNSSSNIDYLPEAKKILGLLGNGHPDKIVKLAVESDAESVFALQTNGMGFIASAVASRRPIEYAPSRSPFPGGDLTIHTTTTVGSDSPPRGGPPVPLSVGPITATIVTPDRISSPPKSALPDSEKNTPEVPGPRAKAFSPPPFSIGSNTASGGAIDPFEFYEMDVTPCDSSVTSTLATSSTIVPMKPAADDVKNP